MNLRIKNKILVKRFYAACVAFLIVTLGATPIAAAADTQKVLRVPFPEVPGFSMIDEKGQKYGLVVDYLNEIAKHTGWKYEYIETSGNDMVDDFLKGSYDLMGGTYYNESLKKYFAYPDYSCGNTKSVLLARWEDHSIRGYDAKDLSGKTIGVVERAAENVRRLGEFLSMNGIDCEIKKYSPEEVKANKINEDLHAGVIDLRLGNITDDDGEFRAVAYIDAQPHYIVVQPDNPEVLRQLNWAMGKIQSSNPDFSNELYEKYFGASGVRRLLLTEEEQEYIQEKGTITVAVPEYFHPFYCVGVEDGGHDGMIPDILNKISSQYDMNFSFVFTDSYAEMQQLVLDGKVDMAGFFYEDTNDSLSRGLVTSTPYSTLNDLIVRNRSATYPGENLTCGLLKGRQLPDYAKASHVKYYDSVHEVLHAVNSGEIDFACGMSARMEQEMQSHVFNNVVPVTLSENQINVSFAMASPADSNLLTIINKGVNSLSEQERVAIRDSNFVSIGEDVYTLRKLIESNPFATVMIIATLSTLIIVVIIVISRARVRAANMKKAVASAEAESKAKSEFLSRMSHEIRTPMNAIVGLSTLISMKEHVPEDIKASLAKLNTSSRYLLGLINDILDMSRIDSGMMKIAEENFSLRQMLDELCSMMQTPAQHKQIELSCTVNLEHSDLVGDPIRLKQVLMNLLSNAIKFTPANGKVSLFVEETTASDTQAGYLFRVSDTGIGIAKADLERIFECFEQTGTNQSRSQGTGLGLPISSNIVQLMGGTLHVKSAIGSGSEFYFEITIPFGTKIEAVTAELSGEIFENARILLAEDNLLNAEIATDLFTFQGAHVELATDGTQAVELFLKREPHYFDLILMDVQMPNMNGLEATKKIRASNHPDAKSIPIIALTANTFQEDRDMARAAGMNDFLSKPLDIDHIHVVLQKWIKKA